MSVRKNDKHEYRQVRCWRARPGEQKKLFYAKMDNQKNVSNSIGQAMKDGYTRLHTVSDLDFQIDDPIEISGKGKPLLIDDEYEELLTEDLNSLRGNARYVKVLLLR